MTTNVVLPPALEKFARDCVADGRYSNVSEVVRAGLRLLQDREEARRKLLESLHEAEEEADRGETFSIEEVIAEIDVILAEEEQVAANGQK